MRRLIAALVVLIAVSMGSADATWTYIAGPIWTTYSVSHTGFSGGFYYGDGTSYKGGVSLATFSLSASPWPSGYQWLGGPTYYCADMSEWIAPSNRTYYWTNDAVAGISIQGTAAGNRRAAWILSNHSSSTDGSIKRAALQLAIWEAIYDNGATLDLTKGNFKVGSLAGGSSADYSAIRTYAATYYGGSSEDGLGVYAYDQQNLLRGVPEPGTVILLGLALAGSGIVLLRRRRS